MPVWRVTENRRQRRSAFDGAEFRHLSRDCPWLRESASADRIKLENTDRLRMSTVRCEHPDCWAKERVAEGGSPFGCVDCGATSFPRGVQRDLEGRYRLCEGCFAARATGISGSPRNVRQVVFEPIVSFWDVGRKNPKAFRRGRPERCERCGRVGGVDAHHRDGDRRNNDPANREWLCAPCHRATPHDRRSYAERNREARVSRR